MSPVNGLTWRKRTSYGTSFAPGRVWKKFTHALMGFPYRPGAMRITAEGTKVTDLPAGRNHHWTKSLIASRDGRKLYVTVGSNSNVGENGMAEEEGRAAIWEVDVATGNKRLFASGMRNANGMAWEPTTGALWAVVNERDEPGNDLVPDYLTSLRGGAFYGWPYKLLGQPRRRARGAATTGSGGARGRPVGTVIDRRGALLVADDVGKTVWRVARQAR